MSNSSDLRSDESLASRVERARQRLARANSPVVPNVSTDQPNKTDDETQVPESKWGQWANWTSWTKVL